MNKKNFFYIKNIYIYNFFIYQTPNKIIFNTIFKYHFQNN